MTRNIAVVVHNDVLRDTRVRKQVGTLVKAGHKVDVYGMAGPKTNKIYPSTIEGSADFILVDYGAAAGRLTGMRMHIYRLFRACAEIGFLMVILAAAYIVAQHASNDQLVEIGLLIGAGALVLVNTICEMYLPQRSRKAWLIRAASTALAYLALLAAVALYDITALPFTLISAAFWLVFKLNVTAGRMYRAAFRAFDKAVSRIGRTYRAKRYDEMAKILADRVMQRQYDVIHCHDIIALIAGVRIKKAQPHLKLVWDAHEMYEDLASSNPGDKRHIQRVISGARPYIDRFITISESFVEFYGKTYDMPEPALVMNATRVADNVTYDGRLHRAAGLSRDRKILLFQGGLSPHRGVMSLCSAAHRLPEPWSIVLMGWGNLEQEVRDQIAILNAEPGKAKLALIPPAPYSELAEWTSGATLGIIPYENSSLNHLYCTPNKLWEFPNAGVPILATDLVEMGKMIREWETGFLLPRDFNSDDIVSFLEDVSSDAIREKRANCERFSHAMSWNRFEPALLSVYA